MLVIAAVCSLGWSAGLHPSPLPVRVASSPRCLLEDDAFSLSSLNEELEKYASAPLPNFLLARAHHD